jgi:hypothetical protein
MDFARREGTAQVGCVLALQGVYDPTARNALFGVVWKGDRGATSIRVARGSRRNGGQLLGGRANSAAWPKREKRAQQTNPWSAVQPVVDSGNAFGYVEHGFKAKWLPATAGKVVVVPRAMVVSSRWMRWKR